MVSVVELLYIECVVLKLNNSSFVVVHIAIVGCTENSDHNWEIRTAIPTVHLVPFYLSFMRSDNGDKTILLQKLVCSLLPEEP